MCMASCTVTAPVAATGPLDGAKEARSTSVLLLGFVLKDGGTMERAARAADIHFVETVDVRTTRVLGVTVSTTIVTGQ